MNIGILHPGRMGVTLASSIDRSIHNIYWASSGRSNESKQRAINYNLIDLLSINNLLNKCDIVFVSALNGGPVEIANEIVKIGYQGLVCDTNNLWGESSYKEMADLYSKNSIDYVEIGIFGWPIDHPFHNNNDHIMYISGHRAEEVKKIFVKDYWNIFITSISAKLAKEKAYSTQNLK